MVGTRHQLHRKAEADSVRWLDLDLDGLQMRHQRGAGIPRSGVARLEHVVAGQRRERDRGHIGEFQPLGREKGIVVGVDLVKACLAERDQIHLVDRQHDMPDAQEIRDPAVTAGLGQDTLPRIDQDDRQIRGRGACRHIARILLMAGVSATMNFLFAVEKYRYATSIVMPCSRSA